MVARSEIRALSQRIEALALRLAPAAELPPCPLIRMTLKSEQGNTPVERQAIAAFLERCATRREAVTFEVDLLFDGAQDVTPTFRTESKAQEI
jgi:hypothetical protein